MLPTFRRFRVSKNFPEVDGVFTLTLEPADGAALFPFQAGQFAMLHLLEPDGTTWAKAAYSFATAPSECADSIDLGIKINGAFTQRASRLVPGDTVGIQGPYGTFTLKTDSRQLVFLAAGIGITPLRSMIRDLILKGDPREMYLFYADKTRDCLAYRTEFEAFARNHENFHFIPFLTRAIGDEWKGERGRITGERLKAYVPSLQDAQYCLCGPPEFMNTLKDFLVAEGVDAKTQIQKEAF